MDFRGTFDRNAQLEHLDVLLFLDLKFAAHVLQILVGLPGSLHPEGLVAAVVRFFLVELLLKLCNLVLQTLDHL